MKDTYLEPAGSAVSERKDRGSRFVADVCVVGTADEAESMIDEIRRRDHDATHHCSAYRVGPEANRYRSSDDGEPGGSAGVPILNQIEARDLTNTLVVVTRYFGGTKLGVGGLRRAYGSAASDALDAAGVRRVIRRITCRIRFDYDDTSAALHCADRFDTKVLERNYSDVTEVVLDVRRGDVAAFESAFVDALGGRGEFVRDAG